MGQKDERDVFVTSAQVARRGTDGGHVEPFRSSLHRLAPVALAALGILGALLTIFAGLVALNDTVLPFKGWPLDAERLNTGAQVLPRAPVETGRLRTAPGGALAAALGGSSPLARVAAAPVPALTITPRVIVQVRRRASHPVSRRTEPKPAPKPSAPVPAPAPVVATPAPAPAPVPVATPVVSSPAPVARRPVTALRQPGTVTPSVAPGKSHGHGGGRANAPGQMKKIAVAAAPPALAATPAVVPTGPAAPAANAGPGKGNGHAHGPPPWAHGHH